MVQSLTELSFDVRAQDGLLSIRDSTPAPARAIVLVSGIFPARLQRVFFARPKVPASPAVNYYACDIHVEFLKPNWLSPPPGGLFLCISCYDKFTPEDSVSNY